ncbi:MAG: FliH/SctL family protein [Melioribacteraceae bacterium]|nr:FliH/SctL family protein [Melioribacteraceae bacterium]
MSDIIKLNIKSKNIRAVIADHIDTSGQFTELPEVLEREKQEHVHKQELEREFTNGYQAGKLEAEKILEQKHSKEMLNQSKDFYSIISTFEEKMKEFENQFHGLVIKVSERIVSKILQEKFETDSIIEKILDQNLRKIIGANDIVIKLNPKDHDLIEKSSKEYFASSGITKIRFASNDNIQIGGCFIESEIGNLDARVETQISEIIKALENNFNKNTTE